MAPPKLNQKFLPHKKGGENKSLNGRTTLSKSSHKQTAYYSTQNYNLKLYWTSKDRQNKFQDPVLVFLGKKEHLKSQEKGA